VIDTLKFDDNVRILDEGYESHTELLNKVMYSNSELWYKIEHPGIDGYVKGADIAAHTFSNYKSHYLYYFTPGKGSDLKVYKYDEEKKMFVDSLTIWSVAEASYKVHELSTTGWKNMDMLFRVDVVQPFCGGADASLVITDEYGKMSKLISSGSYGEEDDDYTSKVYLPVTFINGKTLLIENGDAEHVFDMYTGKMHTFPFPKNLPFPRNELIVKKVHSKKGVTDAEDNPIKNKDGSNKVIIKNYIEYYRWNGKVLKRVKLK
jgi:hypothetical protein